MNKILRNGKLNILKIIICSIIMFFLGCEKYFFSPKPESCIANFNEEDLDFDSGKNFKYFKSQNPKVSHLLLSLTKPQYLGGYFYDYRWDKDGILIDLLRGILHPPGGGYYDLISKDIFLLKNEAKNEIYIFRFPNQKIFTFPYSRDYQLISQSRDLLRIKNGGLFGVINLEGKVIVPFKYDGIELGSSLSPVIAIKGQTKDL
jgi:hypothetical protein